MPKLGSKGYRAASKASVPTEARHRSEPVLFSERPRCSPRMLETSTSWLPMHCTRIYVGLIKFAALSIEYGTSPACATLCIID